MQVQVSSVLRLLCMFHTTESTALVLESGLLLFDTGW
jgi:hypothetical protein